MRIIGSSTLALCHIASGAAEAYYQYGLHCWDIAAAAVIIREAGGCVMDTTGWQHFFRVCLCVDIYCGDNREARYAFNPPSDLIKPSKYDAFGTILPTNCAVCTYCE